MKKSLRINLEDFLDNKLEKDVMYFLGFLFQRFNDKKIKIKLKLWYSDETINKDSLFKFIKVYDIFLKRYKVELGTLKFHEHVWYDIINRKKSKDNFHNKFNSYYETPEQLIQCISHFSTMLNFLITKDTVNGRKNKNSSNRFKNVAKSNKN